MKNCRFEEVRELVKDPSLRITDIARQTGYNKGHVSRLRKEAMKNSSDFECPRCGHCCKSDLATVGEVGVWGVVQCEPQEALEDGWCDWVCPKPQGYLMQCCDCELIHEVDFRVVQYEPKPSEVYEVVDDPNLQAQMRLRRRDDLSPKREWVGLTDDEIDAAWRSVDYTVAYEQFRIDVARAVEQRLKKRNT
jgi:transcription elongation factor Elf1